MVDLEVIVDVERDDSRRPGFVQRGGWTSTGMGAISGFAAEPYSYTSEREVQAASVAACVSIER